MHDTISGPGSACSEATVRPDLLERYDQIYGRRSYAPKAVQAEITERFRTAFAAARRAK